MRELVLTARLEFARLPRFERRKAALLQEHPELRDHVTNHASWTQLRALLGEDSPRRDTESGWFMRPPIPWRAKVRRRAGDPVDTPEEARSRRVQEIQSLPHYTDDLLRKLHELAHRHSYHQVRIDADPTQWLFQFAYLHWLTFGLRELINSHGYVLCACWPEPFRVALAKPKGTTDPWLIRGASAHEVLWKWCVAALTAAQVAAATGSKPRWSDHGKLEERRWRFLGILAHNPKRARDALCRVVPPFDADAWRQRLRFEVVAAVEKSGPDVQELVEQFGRNAGPRETPVPVHEDMQFQILAKLVESGGSVESVAKLANLIDCSRPPVSTLVNVLRKAGDIEPKAGNLRSEEPVRISAKGRDKLRGEHARLSTVLATLAK